MDNLEKFMIKRMKCCFHPYIMPGEGWRAYPPHVAELLKVLTPLHVVVVTDGLIAVDGVYIKDCRGLREKYGLAANAVESVLGEVVDEVDVAFNCVVRRHTLGQTASICLFQGSIWYLMPCVLSELSWPRFAYIPDQNDLFFGHARTYDGDGVECVAVVDGKPEAWIHVSRGFFVEPKPENVELFGDLCFLAQMSQNWVVEKEVKPYLLSESIWTTDDLWEHVATVLSKCIGLNSFKRHGYRELLCGSEAWRRVLKLLDGEND